MPAIENSERLEVPDQAPAAVDPPEAAHVALARAAFGLSSRQRARSSGANRAYVGEYVADDIRRAANGPVPFSMYPSGRAPSGDWTNACLWGTL